MKGVKGSAKGEKIMKEYSENMTTRLRANRKIKERKKIKLSRITRRGRRYKEKKYTEII